MSEKKGVGLALSGGGSRAIAFHYGVFEALHELNIDHKIDVVSAISGGAVIGALWAVYSKDWNSFCQKTELILKEGLEASLSNPTQYFSLIINRGIDPDALASVLDKKIFNGIKLTEIPERPLLILNASDLTTGSNFKFSKRISGSYRSGKHILPNLLLSQAVAYSAAFPLVFLPKKLQLSKEQAVCLADGGAYDCLGANALMPDKDGDISILPQNCETIIISDAASSDYVNEESLNKSVFHGLYGSYATLTRRNKSLIYNKMFILNQNKDIPYLGTIKMDSNHSDLQLGWTQEDLDFVNRYETDFKSVIGKALDLLKEKGRKAAKFIIKKYLSHLM
jgi:NTE family protein